MTKPIDLEPAALEACPMCGCSSHVRQGTAFGQLVHFVECQDAECLVRGPEKLSALDAIAVWNRRAARSAPEAGKAVDGPEEIEIDRLRLAAFQTNSNEDKAAYYLAVSKWFQDRHSRRLASPQAVAPAEETADLRRMSDAHREHAQSAVEHCASLNRLLSIAEANLTASEAEASDLRKELAEANLDRCFATDSDPACKLEHKFNEEATSLRRKLEEATRERDAMVSGLSAIVHCQSALSRSSMRGAAADLLERFGRKPVDFGGDQSPLVTRAEAAVRKLEEHRKALEPFYVVAKTLPDPRLINDEAPGVMARHAPGFKAALGKLVLGDFRRVFWLMEKP